ncbi:hypothetical protein [Streptococcus uberis]|uniref:hypothetical protein n=1 Tax=Streptococcus uberis TaxID=1349 RepID=UPI001FF0E035|nr:hypothetical protein [Streptococcus uberis]MCK1211142.1 hypothetical protein [Streptococcus uberis]MCK1219570.1 hypothetical protein [Streptococcus uberis]MCK1226266.1 hypothetical protein [Streptococcus uberis]
MSNILNSWDFWNTLIASLALMVALYSVWYTRKRDRVSLEIINTWYEEPEGNPFFIGFNIFNNSSTAIRITNIELLNLDNSPASVIDGYEYKSPDDNTSWLSPALNLNLFQQEVAFKEDEIIPSNKDTHFKYYLNPFSPDMKIKVTADRPINRWSKSKTFLVHFVKSD